MKRLALLAAFLFVATLAPAALAKRTERPSLPAKILQADSVFVDCVCPRALAAAQETALLEIRSWGRFQISEDHRHTDLVFLFSGNPYLGDYLTRDGPDKRPVAIVSTILTVIDPVTGQTLWTDSRQWGSWRIRGATKDLIQELRQQIEGETKKWSLNELLMCSVTPVYAGFARLSSEEALARSAPGTGPVSGTPGRLTLSSPDAPQFCKSAQFVFDRERRIVGFEVIASRSDDLDINELLQHADRFDFSGGTYADGGQVYFSAQSKDRKMLIQFDTQGHRSVLSRVTFFY
jgi:hypothetical protein